MKEEEVRRTRKDRHMKLKGNRERKEYKEMQRSKERKKGGTDEINICTNEEECKTRKI
jgi:hypothetical protein